MGIVQKESLRLTIVSYAGASLGYINKILLFTNFLTADQVGLANILTSVALLYAQIAALGVPTISVRFFPFFEEKSKRHHGFLFWTFCIVTIGFLIGTFLFLVFKPWVVSYFGENSPLLIDYYYYLIPLALAFLYFQFVEAYLRALLKTVVSTFLNELLGRLLVTVCISMYALKWIDFPHFVVLYVISNCLLTIILLIYAAYLKQLFIAPARSLRFKRFFKIIMVYGLYTILSVLGGSILSNVDSLMVAGKLNLAQAGIYTTVFFISTVMTFPYRSLQKISQPILARYWKERNMADMAVLYKKASLINMILGGILFLGLWLNVDCIFRFMPKEYHAAKYAFFFLAIGRYIDMATGLNGNITLTSKKYRYDLWFTLSLVILTIILNLLLIPIYGITGAALATMSSLIIYNILRLIFVQYYFKMQPFNYACLWSLLIMFAVWGIVSFIPFLKNKYIDIGIRSTVITVLYGGAVLLLKLSPDVNALAYNFTKLKFLAPKKEV